MQQRILSLIFVLISASCLSAQTLTGTVSGRVADDIGRPISLASVLLLSATDSSLVKTALTNEKGEYHLTPNTNGAFVIKVTMIGFEQYLSGVLTVEGTGINVPDIQLVQRPQELAEVSVSAQKPLIEVHADKLVVNVENSIVNTGSTALEVLSRSPGVTIDNNDNISLKGKQGVNVMINGKVQPMSGQDLANMLKSMPSNAIESIELISNPSSKYDAAGTAGIINIKMKRDKKIGLNGSINATYAQGVYGKSNGGFSANYRNKKLNVFANYNGSYREGFNHLILDRNFFVNGVFDGAYDQDNHYLYKIAAHQGGLGMDYSVSSNTSLGFNLNGALTDFRRDGYNFSKVKDASGAYVSSFATQNNSPNVWNNQVANLNLRHTFDSTGKSLAVDVDYAAYPNSGTQAFTTRYNNMELGDTTGLPAPVLFNGNLSGLTQIRSAKADFSMTLPKGISMDLGAKVSYVTAQNDLSFFNEVGGASVPDSGRTNNFLYKEHINAAYVNLSGNFGKWSTQLGLRAEQTIASGQAVSLVADSSFTRNYAQLFPSFAVQRHLNAHNDLGITLSRRIERPDYEQLNPSAYYMDPTTYKTGDPYINPALSYAADLSYIYKQRFITSLNYTIVSQPITQVLQPSPTEEKVTIQTQKNLTSMASYGISGSYRFSIFKWWENTTNINGYYGHYTGDIAGTNLNSGKVTYNLNTSNSFMLPNNWSAEIGGFYQAPQVYGYMDLKSQWMLNLGVQKNLFDKRATLRLNATDVFWRGYPRATSYYTGYVESFVAIRDTRQVVMSFTYRFGKRTVPSSMRHRGGAEDEKRRAGSEVG